MSRRFLHFSLTSMLLCWIPLLSQPQTPAPKPQTARQALIEMITHGGEAVQKHLTVEVQDLLKTGGNSSNLDFATAVMKPGPGFETFDSGEVLLSYADSASKMKYEVHVENDDLSGDEDTLLLSIHLFREGKEQDDAIGWLSSHFNVNMKLQQNVWRLNKISVGAEFPIGDPSFVKKTLLNASGRASSASAGLHTLDSHAHTSVQFDSSGGQPAAPAAMAPEQVISLLGVAESTFARVHPDAGFTCSLKDLVEMSKLMGVDEQVSTGTYNGYHFALAGCEGTPAGSYQVIAEPLIAATGSKAFCTDATSNVRISEDGRGATCLVSGKVQRQDSDEGGMVGIQIPTTENKPARQE
jgi:hypothetical protein